MISIKNFFRFGSKYTLEAPSTTKRAPLAFSLHTTNKYNNKQINKFNDISQFSLFYLPTYNFGSSTASNENFSIPTYDEMTKIVDNHYDKGELNEAYTYLNNILKIDSNYIYCYYTLFNLNERLGKVDENLELFESILDKVEEGSEDEYNIRRNLGHCRYGKGENELSRVQFERCLEIFPDDPDICKFLGQIFEDENEVEKAISYYQKSVEVEPDQTYAQQGLARMYMKQRKFYEAAQVLKPCADKYPTNVPILHALAQCYQQQNLLDRCLGLYFKVLDLDPNYVHCNFGILNAYLQKGMYQEALNRSEKLINTKGINKIELYQFIGVVHSQMGNESKTKKYFQLAETFQNEEYMSKFDEEAQELIQRSMELQEANNYTF